MDKDYIFGIRAIIEAVTAGKEVERVLVKKDSQGVLFFELLKTLSEHNIPVQYVPIEKINRVTRKNHQGAVALVSPITFQNIENVIPTVFESGQTPLVLVLDRITDVRNFGAIARTAECVGAHAIIVPEKGSASINSDAIKTSAGALHKIPVCRAKSLMKAVTFLKQSGLNVYAASEKSADNYYEADFTVPTALIMGAEDRGISADLMKWADGQVKIPMVGEIASLNVSVAAGVLLFETLRQRQGQV